MFRINKFFKKKNKRRKNLSLGRLALDSINSENEKFPKEKVQ